MSRRRLHVGEWCRWTEARVITWPGNGETETITVDHEGIFLQEYADGSHLMAKPGPDGADGAGNPVVWLPMWVTLYPLKGGGEDE